MIVVDSSVWIGALRNHIDRPVLSLRRMVRERSDEVLVGDVVLMEVLQGARGEAHAARIERNLRQYTVTTMLGEALAIRAADHYRFLRTRGITIRKTIDLIIGTFCIVHGHSLLHDDRDFGPMADHLGLIIAPF